MGGRNNTTVPTLTDGQRGDLQLGTRGSLKVQIMNADGTSALSIATSGADGGTNNTNGLRSFNYSSVFNGSTWDRMPGDTTGSYVVKRASATGGYSYLNIAAGQATTVVKASAGTLHSIVLNSAATATNTTVVYDHPSGVGTVIGRPAVTTATVPTTLIYDIAFANGLTIITATANGGDMTVVYK